METEDKNRDVSQRHALFCEETLGKIDAKDIELFRNGLSHEFYRLKVLMTLDKLNTSVESFVVCKWVLYSIIVEHDIKSKYREEYSTVD